MDDLPANQLLVRRSLPARYEEACELVLLDSGGAALEQLALGLDPPRDLDRLPDVVFMDFFLGDGYGSEVTKQIRAAFAASGLAGPFIVGHSSSMPASFEIVRAGGDVVIEKDRHAPCSTGIRSLFPDLAALRSYAGRARRPLV